MHHYQAPPNLPLVLIQRKTDPQRHAGRAGLAPQTMDVLWMPN